MVGLIILIFGCIIFILHRILIKYDYFQDYITMKCGGNNYCIYQYSAKKKSIRCTYFNHTISPQIDIIKGKEAIEFIERKIMYIELLSETICKKDTLLQADIDLVLDLYNNYESIDTYKKILNILK